jgi:hypothetical protein
VSSCAGRTANWHTQRNRHHAAARGLSGTGKDFDHIIADSLGDTTSEQRVQRTTQSRERYAGGFAARSGGRGRIGGTGRYNASPAIVRGTRDGVRQDFVSAGNHLESGSRGMSGMVGVPTARKASPNSAQLGESDFRRDAQQSVVIRLRISGHGLMFRQRSRAPGLYFSGFGSGLNVQGSNVEE